MENIIVSIICNTYNHEKYIGEALESFLMQKTQFAYEILVHDDASTDRTADIIREYEEKYPDIVKPICQEVNQHSQRIGITLNYQYPRVKGKYIAFCEGDDYWTDANKLQRQVDALEAHPEIDICVHQAFVLRDGKIEGKVTKCSEDKVFSVEEVILGGGGMVATGSLLYRASLMEQMKKVMSLDYAWQIQGSLRGGMLFLAEPMSAYRVMTSGSWTVRMQKDKAARMTHVQKVEKMLLDLDEQTDHIYTDAIQLKIQKNKVFALIDAGEYKAARAPELRKGYAILPTKQKIKLFMLERLPWVLRLLGK